METITDFTVDRFQEPVLWIRGGSGSASNKNQDQDPHPDPHQSDKLDQETGPNPHQFTDDKPKCMEYAPI